MALGSPDPPGLAATGHLTGPDEGHRPDSTEIASLGSQLRKALAVARCELRLQRRSPALWIAVVLLMLASGGLAASRWSGTPNSSAAAATVAGGLIIFGAALSPWLFMGTFSRDRQRRFGPLLWTRPLAPAYYALGKGIAGGALAMTVGIPPLIVGYVTAAVAGGAPPMLAPWIAMVGSASASMCLVVLFALLCSCATDSALVGVLASSALLLYFAAASTQSMLLATNLAARSIFASPSIGFGPDGALLLAQRIVGLALAMFCLFLVAVVVQAKERQIGYLPARWVLPIGVAAALLVLLVGAYAHFRVVAAGYVALGPAPAVPMAAQVSNYQLSLSLDPASGRVSGTAAFVLSPSNRNEQSALFALNPGLRVQRVALTTGTTDASPPSDPPALSGPSLPFTTRLGWTRVDLGRTAFTQGTPVGLTVAYAGELALDRDDYASASAGLTGVGKPFSQLAPVPVRDYVGQGIAFLEGQGDWYPLLWTQQTVVVYPARQSFDRLEVRIPNSYDVISSLGAPGRSGDGQWQTIALQRPGVLPMAVLAVLASPKQARSRGQVILYQGARPTAQTVAFGQETLQLAQQLDRWLGPPPEAGESRALTAVLVPFIQRPVLGGALLLLPETPDRDLLSAASFSTAAAVRVPAQGIAEAWWRNVMPFQSARPAYFNGGPDTQTPAGRIFLDQQPPQLLSLLATYSAAVIADRELGHGFLAKEEAARQAYHRALFSANQGNGQGSANADIAGAEAQMRSLGISGDAIAGDAALPLFSLVSHVGPERTTAFLRQFQAAQANAPASVAVFMEAASALHE